MIFEWIINGFLWLLNLIFTWISLPAAPLVMTSAMSNIMQFFAIPIGLLRNYLGDHFFIATVGMILAYITIAPVIFMSIWLYKRIRG